MSKLKRPLRLWHGVLAIVAALAVGAAGTAIAGGGRQQGPDDGRVRPAVGFLDREVPLRVQGEGHPARQQPENVRLKCPRGTRVIAGGGGGFSNDPNEQDVNFSGPFDSRDRGRDPEDGWIDVREQRRCRGRGHRVEAICVDKR